MHLIRARQLKAVGFTASAAILGIGLIAAWVQGVRLPLPEQLPLSAPILAGTAATVLLLSAVLKDKAQVEVHKGRLYIQWGSPSTGTPLIDGSIEVNYHCNVLQCSRQFALFKTMKGKSPHLNSHMHAHARH